MMSVVAAAAAAAQQPGQKLGQEYEDEAVTERALIWVSRVSVDAVACVWSVIFEARFECTTSGDVCAPHSRIVLRRRCALIKSIHESYNFSNTPKHTHPYCAATHETSAGVSSAQTRVRLYKHIPQLNKVIHHWADRRRWRR